DSKLAQGIWEAEYVFSQTGNKVHNIIHSSMEFQDDLIVKHTDHFSFWRWSKMALGTTGLILGWTPFIRAKVQKLAMQSLSKYMAKEKS
ncbi:MAG: nuclear transport factor 2 family protein, partial [Bacteroidota bacterium]